VTDAPHDQPRTPARRALLDTTVQLDRVKYPSRMESLERLLAGFDFKFAASLSLVEFKATVSKNASLFIISYVRKGHVSPGQGTFFWKRTIPRRA